MYRFVRIDNTNLVCYRNGTILRFHRRWKKWNICNGSKDTPGYLQIHINKKMYGCHRVLAHAFGILDIDSPLQIDHRDLNKTNNCIFNLRPATHQQNNFNKNAKGYYWNKSTNKWHAQIMLDGKSIYLGYFEKEGDAKKAYIDAKKKYHVLGC